jgi:hypothetical protein
MKLITYSLFHHESSKPFERRFYVMGMYLNVRMNNLLFPDWQTHVEVDKKTLNEYAPLLYWLKDNARLSVNVNDVDSVSLCGGMCWRIKPIYYPEVSHVLCQDSDALTSYREALVVQRWLESGKKCLAMLDNRAHSGLMGGMVGFDSAYLRSCMEAPQWGNLVHGWDFSQRGSDQNWMNAKMLPRIKDEVLWFGSVYNKIPDKYSAEMLPGVNSALWESNLCSEFIGAPGFNIMEALRSKDNFKKFFSGHYKCDR